MPSGPRLTALVELREMEKYMEQQLRQVMLSHKALTDPQCLGVLENGIFFAPGQFPRGRGKHCEGKIVFFFMLCQKRKVKTSWC